MKIISGGQTGADIAGVDAAISCQVPYGGWLPKGRKTEDKPVDKSYVNFRVMSQGGYPKRTEANIIDSDGTVLFTFGHLKGGSLLTKKISIKHNKPWLHIDLNVHNDHARQIQDWLNSFQIKTLNIAGSRASKSPDIYNKVKKIIIKVLQKTASNL